MKEPFLGRVFSAFSDLHYHRRRTCHRAIPRIKFILLLGSHYIRVFGLTSTENFKKYFFCVCRVQILTLYISANRNNMLDYVKLRISMQQMFSRANRPSTWPQF